MGRQIDPDLIMADLHREGREIIRPGLEGSAAHHIKAGIVPIAGEQTIFHGSPMEGKPHVGTAIVYGIDNEIT